MCWCRHVIDPGLPTSDLPTKMVHQPVLSNDFSGIGVGHGKLAACVNLTRRQQVTGPVCFDCGRNKWLPGQFRSVSPHLDHPGHIPTAFRSQPYQQQVARVGSTGEVRDGDLMTAPPAPNVGQQAFLGFSGNGGPQLGCGAGEGGNGFDVHGLAVWTQSSQGRTSHPQSALSSADLDWAAALVGFGSETLWVCLWTIVRAIFCRIHVWNPPRKWREISHVDDVPKLFGSIPTGSKCFDSFFFSEGRDQINSHRWNYQC